MLDDPIYKWLLDHPNIERTITIHQLLNHTSGVFDWVEHPQSPFRIPYNSIDFSRIWTPSEVLKTLVDEPYFPPGSGWHYSTTNYNLLRMIAEKVTQSTVSIELQKRFLEPLNLNHTLILDFETTIPDGLDIAHGWYDGDGDGSLDDISSKAKTWIATLCPAMMYSTAEDLARWSQALYQGEVLGQEYLGQMLTFHRPTPGGTLLTGYGLGTGELAHKTIEGLRAWGHLGWHYGYMAAMLYLPDDSASIVILINDNNQDCMTYVGLGLWLVIKFHNSKTRFIAAGYSLLMFLSMFVVWPAGYLLSRLRTRRSGAAEVEHRRRRSCRIARIVAILTAIVMFGISFLFILHLVNPQGPLDWKGGSLVEKAILGLAFVGTVLSVILAFFTFRAWKDRYWSIPGRAYYTLITLAALSSVCLFQAFDLLPF